MITAGLDIGTRTAKVVLLQDGKILAAPISPVNDAVDKLARCLLKSALQSAGVSRWKIKGLAATGYGRKAVKAARREFPDAVCVAQGAHFLDPEIRTVIDIGGLITRAIMVGKNGGVEDYLENEKCASGSGRFLEMIAEALEVPIAEIGPLSLRAKKPLDLTSQCVVFAESEVVSRVNAGEEPADILAGLHSSIAERAATIARRLGFQPPVAVVGGVAKNRGVIHFLEKSLGLELTALSQDPQTIAALGAALMAKTIK